MFLLFLLSRPVRETVFAALTLAIFTVVSLAPAQVLAFEADLSTAMTTQFIASADLNGRDPYIANAINALPDYDFAEAGSVAAPSMAVTIPGKRNLVPTFAAAPPRTRIKPTLKAPVVLEGEASYYSRAGCLGCDSRFIMANGQPLNDHALTMAIGADKKHLVGYKARVTSLATGKTIEVLITDTGGFYQAKYGYRVADLTIATKEAIGMKGGVGQVRVEVF